MPPRLNFHGTSRSLTIRSNSLIASYQPRFIPATSQRGYADGKDPKPKGPNQHGLGSVSEEAADMGKITGESRPDLEQGTPVQEILQRDKEGRQNAPEVIKEDLDKKNSADTTSFENLLALGQIQNVANGGYVSDPVEVGYKFGLPELPLASEKNMKHRYDTVVTQVTNLIMKDGKKSVAQRNMSFILNHLRTAPPPVPNASRPLVPGSPPASHLPLDPIQYLTVAIDSVAPLLRIRQQKGAAGGGTALQIPVPLGLRQRRRQAFQWILDAASKKKSRGSGRGLFAQRVAEEIIGVVEGKSSAWEKRSLVHKTGTTARANLNYKKSVRF